MGYKDRDSIAQVKATIAISMPIMAVHVAFWLTGSSEFEGPDMAATSIFADAS